MEREHVFRCADLLSLSSLQGAYVAAGKDHLDQKIDRVNIMEVPDIENWAQSGEFLITTGYAYKNDESAFLRLIPQLKERDVAALGIKPKRFIQAVSDAIIEQADQYGLPLFILPPETIFSDVVKEVMERVIVQETEEYRILHNRLEEIACMILEDQDMQVILERLESFLQCRIGILDEGEILYAAPISRVELEENGAAYRYAFQKEGVGAELWMRPDPQLQDSLNQMTIQRLIPFLEAKVAGDRHMRKIKSSYTRQFLHKLLMGTIQDERELRLLSQSAGLGDIGNKRGRLVLLLPEKGQPPASLKKMTECLNRCASLQGKPVLWGVQSPGLWALMLYEDEPPDIYKELKSILRQGMPEMRFQFFVGGEESGLLRMGEVSQNIQSLMQIAIQCHQREEWITWDQVGIYQILVLIPEHSNVDRFLRERLEILEAYDLAKKTNLVETLEMYLDTGSNIKLTAERMYTHYNTILYRLERIREITGHTMQETGYRLELEIALKLRRIYKRNEEKKE